MKILATINYLCIIYLSDICRVCCHWQCVFDLVISSCMKMHESLSIPLPVGGLSVGSVVESLVTKPVF